MARVNNLTNFLNDVATAIKQKLGDNTPIPASQFDTKIGEIFSVDTTENILGEPEIPETPDPADAGGEGDIKDDSGEK